jgi:hypothetical protein
MEENENNTVLAEKSHKIERSREEKEVELARILMYAEERWDKKITEKKKEEEAVKIKKLRQKINALDDRPMDESSLQKTSVRRVVGKAPESDKQKILKWREAAFSDQKTEEGETPMSPEQIQIADMVNKATNEILQKYGLPVFDIPPANIHVILKKYWKGQKFNSYYTQKHQKVVLKENGHLSDDLIKVFHEMLHFKSYGAAQILMGDEKLIQQYRTGLQITARNGERDIFTNLNEAVTEEMTKKYVSKLLDNPLFKKEQDRTQKEKRKFQPSTMEDVYYMENVDEQPMRNAIRRIFKMPEKKYSYYMAYSYENERETLNTLIAKLFTKNPGKFKDENEIMEMFEKAMLTGNILPIGRLIDTTFPKKTPEENGTFRQIGEMGEDTEGLKKFIEEL